MTYPPREGDLTRDEILKMATDLINKGIDVWFKFTCPTCGFRCTASTKNTLSPEYECFECKTIHEPQRFGLLIAIEMGSTKQPPLHGIN